MEMGRKLRFERPGLLFFFFYQSLWALPPGAVRCHWQRPWRGREWSLGGRSHSARPRGSQSRWHGGAYVAKKEPARALSLRTRLPRHLHHQTRCGMPVQQRPGGGRWGLTGDLVGPGSRVPTCPGGRPRDSDPRQADATSKRVYWTFAQTGSPPQRWQSPD